MKTRWMKKSLCLLLALVLCLSVLSPAALAAEDVVLPEEQSEAAPDTRIDAQPEASAPVPAEPEAQPAAEGKGDGESPDAAAEDAAAPSDAEEPGEEAEPSEAPALEEPETQPEEPEALPEEGEADEALPEETDEDAEETGEPVELRSFSLSYINPLYADVVSEADLPTPRDPEHYRTALRDSMGKKAAAEEEPITYCQTVEEASASFRAQFIARNAEIAVYYRFPADADMNALLHAIFDGAMAHTGNPREGDYLSYQYGGWNVSVSYAYADETTYNCSIVYSVLYYTSAAQESEMDGRVSAILGQLDLGGKSDQQKLEAIYAYLCANVVYDFDNLNNDEYKLKYTGYAALCNGTAVCQGISVAFYRLCLASGVDARVVDCDDMCHAWNIARCHGAYYALDATWDLGAKSPVNYWYFLKGSTYWLSSHTANGVSSLGDQYQNAAFASLYAIPAEDCNLDEDEPTPTPTSTPAPTPSEPEFGTYEQLNYRLLNGEITITGCDTSATSINIPAQINGYPVTAIADNAFQSCSSITSISLPEGLKYIGASAFRNCKLKTVTIPASVESIGERAFSTATIESVSVASGSAFFSSVDGVLFSKDKTTLVSYPQARTGAYTTMPKTVTTIEAYAFSGCNLTGITIPAAVTSVGKGAFEWSFQLTSISLPSGISEISEETFEGCFNLKSINLPSSIIEIGTYAFGFTGLTHVEIPRSVQTIGNGAFQDCGSLHDIFFEHRKDDPLSFGNWVFEITSSNYELRAKTLTNIYVPDADPSNINDTIYSYGWADHGREITYLSATSAPEFGTYEKLSFRRIGNEITITSCDISTSGNVTVPAKINGYPVIAITDYAFSNCDNITSVTLSEGLKSIGNCAFEFCSHLNSVVIPASVEYIGLRAFTGAALTRISVNTGNTHYSSVGGVLYDKNQTTLLLCPQAFSGEYAAIPTTVKIIADYAFSDCHSLTGVNIPASVTSIGQGAFSGCIRLASISLPNGITEINDNTFCNCPRLKSVSLPSSVTTIGNGAFEATALTNIVIPSSVQVISSSSFRGCSSLKDIVFWHTKDDPLSLGDYAFDFYRGDEPEEIIVTNIYVPDATPGNINASIASYDWVAARRDVTFLSSSEAPEPGTYQQLSYQILKGEITITGCDSSITGEVTIPAEINGYSVVAIADRAFYGCDRIKGITLPDGLLHIGNYSFYDCGFQSVSIPASVESIGTAAFSGNNLVNISVKPENAYFSSVDGVLFNKDQTILLLYPKARPGAYTTMPNTVTAIADYAFYFCIDLTDVTIPAGVKTIGTAAFSFCLFLESVRIPSTVKEIGESAFSFCGDLVNISLPEGITEIRDRLFYQCSKLKKLTIPSSVTLIGTSAFEQCGLTYIVIPDSVQKIEDDAFSRCNSLKDFYFSHEKDSSLTIGSNAFSQSSSGGSLATTIYLPGEIPDGLNDSITSYDWASDRRDVTFVSFRIQTFNISYILNGGTNSPANPERYSSLDTVSLAAPTREGYAFAGWYASEDFSGDPVAVLAGGVPAVLYAKWAPIEYSIHFDPNGGSGTIQDLHGCQTDVRYPLPESGFTRTGHSLAGWNTAPDGSGAAYLPGEEVVNLCSVPDGSVTLYAIWTPNPYTIAFDGNGADGEAMEPMETLFGQNTALPACTLSRTGYHFTGWNTRADGKGTAYADGVTVLSLTAEAGGIVTFYAQWSPNAYALRFDPNGGTGTMAAQAMTYDKEAALRANSFKKASHVFLGWATEPDALSPLYLDKQKVSNLTAAQDGALTLYAVWAKYSYQIVFNANGGSGDMADDGGFCEYDGVYTLPACGFTREGFDFLGWATSAKGKVVYQDGQSIQCLSSKNGTVIKLFAVWQAHSYRVAFDGNGGTGTMKALSCTCGKVYTLTANAFKRTGYTFAGWNTAPDGSGATYANKAKQMNFATESGALLTLYAQWTPTEYKITYKNVVAGDGNPNPETYTVESETIVLAPAFRPGCDFAGWFSDAKFKTPVTEIAAGGTGARTLYAKWVGTANTYGIVFDPNGGTGTTKAMAKLSCGKAYALTANAFKRAGYTFAGWNTAPDGSGTAYANKEKVTNLCDTDGGSVTLFAQWTPVVYKITYKNALYDGNTNPATFTPESETIVLAPVSRAGCVFGGWFTDAKFKTPITEIATGRVGNLTLYAKWTGKAATYTIAFDGNGASSGKMKEMTKRACGSAYALTANAFKRTGYSFAGWNTAPDSSGAAYANKEKVANLCHTDGGTVTLYAQWTPIAYTISYKNIGPALTPEKTSYTIEESFELPTPVKVGHAFLGWYSTAAFKDGTQVRSIEPGTTGNLTLYAKWMLLRG